MRLEGLVRPATKQALVDHAALQGLDGVGEAIDSLSVLLAGAQDAQREALAQRDAALRRNDELLAAVRELRRKVDHQAQQLTIYRASRKPRRRAQPAPPAGPALVSFHMDSQLDPLAAFKDAEGFLPAWAIEKASTLRCGAGCGSFLDPGAVLLNLDRCPPCRAKP